jgi:hypothetical protein
MIPSTSILVRSGQLKWLIQTLAAFLGSDVSDLIKRVWKIGKLIPLRRANQGIYEVLDYESCLELVDAKGKKATFNKRERVRFTQDNVIAYQDKAWGDGNIFAKYKCSPGVEVDRYREGHRYRILISLRQTKNRGDVEEFRIERTIANGFCKTWEHFQTEIDHVTRRMALSIIFPRKRPAKQVILIEQNTTRTEILDTKHWMTLPDGRRQVTWRCQKPRLFEAYILRWEW